MVCERRKVDFKQFKEKKQNEILDKLLNNILNGRFNGNLYEINDDADFVTFDESDESYETVELNEDVLGDVLSLTIEGRDEETGNKTDERFIEIYHAICNEIFNVIYNDIRDDVVKVLLSEIESGLFDEILYGVDFDCEVFRSRLKTIIMIYEHNEESDENEPEYVYDSD